MKLRINEAVESKFTEEQMRYAAGQNYVVGMKVFDAFKSAGFNPEFEFGKLRDSFGINNSGEYYIDSINITMYIGNMIFKFRASVFDTLSQNFYVEASWGFGGYSPSKSSYIKIEDAEKLLSATKLAYKLIDEVKSQFDKIIKTIEKWSE